MSVFFLANALWWGYRAGATIARGFLDSQAAQAGTTLDAAFRNAEERGARGELNQFEQSLIGFVRFNNQYAWTDPAEFAVDTAAVGTAGLGLVAKIGLGKRIATVAGVKAAVPAGNLIDALIDFTGGVLTGSLQTPNPADLVRDLFALGRRTEGAVGPVIGAGGKVLEATTGLARVIAPFLGAPLTPATGLKALVALPAAVKAGTDLLGSILNLWSVAEPLIPEIPLAREALPLDPAFRNALKPPRAPLPLDPAFRNALENALPEVTPDLPPPPPAEPPPVEPEPLPPVVARVNRPEFIRRFSGGLTDFRRIIAELKEGA